MLQSSRRAARRTVLLLVATALALVAAGGIALAASFTCDANPCYGTIDDDVITGTPGDDEIFAREANDTLNGEDGNDTMRGELGDDQLDGGDGTDQLFGEDGTDRLNGGAGNDILDGGGGGGSDPHTTKDIYFLTANWGSDTVTDADGTDDILPVPDGGATAAVMPNLTVNLVSSTDPEVTDGNGNTVNWNNNEIENVFTGAGDDVISQSPDSQSLSGSTGNDTYQGYAAVSSEGGFGDDTITDVGANGTSGGTADVLDLSSRNLAEATWRTPRSTTVNLRTLQISINSGICSEEYCRHVRLSRYFDDTSTDACMSGPGPGVIETIRFADGQSVGFSRAQSLAASLDGTDNDRDGNTDEPNETCPAPPEEDTTAPTVNTTIPVDDATGVAPTANTSATFSEDMDQSTLTTGTFTLTKQGSASPLEATVSYDGANRKATLDPASDLEASTTYVATVKGGPGGAKDPAGNALAQDHTWTFATASPPAPVCTLSGKSSTAETITGTPGDDVICGGVGPDTIKGLGGNDTLRGQDGNDTLLGGVGNDALDGGLGTDTGSYSASLTAVIASLATNSATGEGSDTFLGVENLLGSSKADALTGSGTNNRLTGGGGGDTEHGGSGNDTVIGGGGGDTLKGEDGADTVNSKDGVSGNDSLDGGTGTDTKVTDATEKSVVGFP